MHGLGVIIISSWEGLIGSTQVLVKEGKSSVGKFNK